MKNVFTIFLILICLLLGTSIRAEQSQLTCKTGPVKKRYGQTNWLVYSCSDNKSLLILSGAGNPATPFYFMFFMQNGHYKLTGEGTGNKAATDAAYNELRKLKVTDLTLLLQQIKNSK